MMHSAFLKKWSRDYLHQLQRHKWFMESNNIQHGAVALMKDNRTSPLQWKVVVIEEVHYGSDELVRVADVRTQSGIFRRAVHKFCPLPGDAEKSISMRFKRFICVFFLFFLPC